MLDIETKNRINGKLKLVKDWPKKGINFIDITPLVGSTLFNDCVRLMSNHLKDTGIKYIASPEARGFIFGAAVAQEMGIGFIPIRKPNKLPREQITAAYDLEYRSDELSIHKDSIRPGEKVAIVDDILATGGTIMACEQIFKIAKAEIVSHCFFAEIKELQGRQKITQDVDVFCLMTF